MQKKVLSLLLAAALLLSSIPAALAQQVESAEKSWRQSFSGLGQNAVPDTMLLGGVPANYAGAETLPEEQKNIAVTKGENGLFGKKSDDTAFSVTTAWDGSTLPTIAPDTAAYSGVTLKNDAGSDDKTAILPGITALAADDVVHISFEYALNNYASARQVKLRTRPTSKVVSDTSSVFLSFAQGTGALKVFGKDADGFVMPLDQWVRFDCIFKEPKRTGGSFADVYANGRLIAQDITFDARSGKPMDVIDPLTGIATLVFTFPMGQVDGVYPETKTFVDNFSIDIGKNLPQITDVNLTHSDAQINGNINNEAKTVQLPSSVTAAAFLDGLNMEVELVDANGIIQSGGEPVRSGYIRVPHGDGDYFYNLTVFEQSFYLKEDFTGKTVTSAEELAQNTDLTAIGSGVSVTVQTQTSLGGRDNDDVSVAVTADGFTGAEGEEAALAWEPDATVSSDKITVEQAVLLKPGAYAQLQAIFGGTTGGGKSIAAFTEDHKIFVNGTDSGLTWEENRFYRVAAAIDRTAGTWSVYVNGAAAVENVPVGLDGIESLAGLKNLVYPAEGSTAAAVFDDFKIHSGEYVPGADRIVVAASTDDCILSGKTVYILSGTDREQLAGYLSLDNCILDAVYTDATLTQKVTDTTLSDGNVLLFTNPIRTVYEGYTISVLQDVLGIESSSYAFDNLARTVSAPVGMPAGEFYKEVTLYSGHTGQIVDAQGTTVAADHKIQLGSDWKYRVSYQNMAADYTLETAYVNETFDALAGQKLFTSGERYQGLRLDMSKIGGSAENAFLEGVKDGEENVARFYSNASKPASDAKITLRLDNIAPAKSQSPFALTWDMKASDLLGLNSIVFRYTHKDGTPDKYYNFLNIQGGNVEFAGSNVGTYEADEWVRVAIVVSPGSSATRMYLNGQKVWDRTVGFFQKTCGHIDDIIITHGVTDGKRETQMDNIAFYPVYNLDAYDASAMDSSASSTYDIIGKDKTITGYGPATVETFLGLFAFPEGAAKQVVTADGTPLGAQDAVTEGMTLVVTSADGQYSTRYPIGARMRIETALNIDGRQMGYLVEGPANATAQVYSALPQEMKLSLAYTNTADPAKNNEAADQKTVSGEATFDTGVVAQVANVEGETLAMRLTDPATGKDLVASVTLTYTGQLDLGSEIMAAKNGATSIVTLTMDDGVQGYVEKFNNLYKTYGLRGTSMVWADRLSSNQAFYQRIFDEGYIDLGSHSKTHTTLTNSVTDEVRHAELDGAQSEMRAMFPGQEVITYAPADNKLDDRSAAIAKETYWAIRQGKRGFNSLSPADSGIGGWYDLKIQGVYNPVNQAGEDCSLDDLLDIAAAEPMWMIEMFHGLDGGFGAVSTAVATQHFAKMGKMQDEGKIWVASFPEATKYIRERQNTVIEDVATENDRTVTLTMAGLPEDIFCDPLTVKSEVPAGWTYAKVTQGGAVQAPEIVAENGRYYIYYNAIPNKGGIKIENVAEKPMISITGLKIISAGELTQNAGATSAVTFTAETTPAGNVDDTGIGWYVNGARQADFDGNLEFVFTPQEVGTYTVYALDSKTGIRSGEKTITVREPGLQFEDDFNGYGDAVTVPSQNWYSNAEVGLAAVSLDDKDKAAVFGYIESTKYPALHKTANAAVGTPLVYRAKVRLDNNGTNKQAFYLEMRNSKTGNVAANRKTVFKISGDTISSVTGEAKAKIPIGKWLSFSVCIVPGEEGANSKIRVSLSSPDLTNLDGGEKGKDIVFEDEVSLDVIGIFTNGTCNMLFNNDFSKANDQAKTYLDDVRIYNPNPLRLTAPSDPVDPGSAVTIALSKDVYGLDAAKITVTKEGSQTPVTVKDAVYSLLTPGKLVLTFAEGALEKGATYTVTLAESVLDAAGAASGGTVSFTTSEQDTPVRTDLSILDGVSCYVEGETVTLISDTKKDITVYAAVFETIEGAAVLKEIAVYPVVCEAGVEQSITVEKPQTPLGSTAELLIWEDGTLKPITKPILLQE